MDPCLKYRTRFTSSIKNELVEPFNKLSQDTRITKSRLLDEAIEDLLTKHNKKPVEKQSKVELACLK